MRQLRRHFTRTLGEEGFQSLPEGPVQLGPATWRQSGIEHLAVERMLEFVPLRHDPAWQLLRASGPHDVMTPRELFAEIFKFLRIEICRGRADACQK